MFICADGHDPVTWHARTQLQTRPGTVVLDAVSVCWFCGRETSTVAGTTATTPTRRWA